MDILTWITFLLFLLVMMGMFLWIRAIERDYRIIRTRLKILERQMTMHGFMKSDEVE